MSFALILIGALAGFVFLAIRLARSVSRLEFEARQKADEAPDVARLAVESKRMADDLLAGDYHSSFKGVGIDYHESRPYSLGDEVRSMDWKVTARSREPYVKLYHESRELAMGLIVDFSPSLDFGSRVESKRALMTRLISSLAFSALANNDKVALLAFTDRIERFIPASSGPRHVMRLIHEARILEPLGRGSDIGGALSYAREIFRRRSLLFVISDFFDVDFDRPMRALAGRHDLIAIELVDPVERRFDQLGVFCLRDAESAATSVGAIGNMVAANSYRDRARREQSRLKSLLASAGADHITVSTEEGFQAPLMRYFSARGKRRARVG